MIITSEIISRPQGCFLGQLAGDSEMALALARSLVKEGRYNPIEVEQSHVDWLHTGPFDFGHTISGALTGTPNAESQANGALMRVSPLGIFGVGKNLTDVATWDGLCWHFRMRFTS